MAARRREQTLQSRGVIGSCAGLRRLCLSRNERLNRALSDNNENQEWHILTLDAGAAF